MVPENIHQKSQVHLGVYDEAVRTVAWCGLALGAAGYTYRVQSFTVMGRCCLLATMLIQLLPTSCWKDDKVSPRHFRTRLFTYAGVQIAALLALQSIYRPLRWAEASVLIGGYGVKVYWMHRRSGVDDYIANFDRQRVLVNDHDRRVEHFRESDSYLDDLFALRRDFPEFRGQLNSAFLEARKPEELFSDPNLNWKGKEQLAIDLLSSLEEPVCGVKRTKSLYRVLDNLDGFSSWDVGDVSSHIFADLYGEEPGRPEVLRGAFRDAPRGVYLEYCEESLCDIHDANGVDIEGAKKVLQMRLGRAEIHWGLYLKLWRHPIGILYAAMAGHNPEFYAEQINEASRYALVSTYCYLLDKCEEERAAILERLLPRQAKVSSAIDIVRWQIVGAHASIKGCVSLRQTCHLVKAAIGLFPEIGAQPPGPRRDELAVALLTKTQQELLQQGGQQ